MAGKSVADNVFKNENGRLYVRIAMRINGKKVERTATLPEGAKLPEAKALAVQLRAELEASGQAQTGERKAQQLPTLAFYAAEWCAGKAAKLRGSVTDEWIHRLAAHVLPVVIGGRAFGEYPLDEIRRMTVEAWAAWAQKAKQKNGRPYSPDTVAGWWRVVTQCLRDAAADYDLPDPTRRVQAPKIENVPQVRTKVTLTPAQVEALINAAAAMVPGRYAEVALLAMTGCRSGEVFGLHWQEVDFAGGTVTFKHSATRGVLEPTKTGSERIVPMRPRLASILEAHRDQQSRRKREAATGLVFPSEVGSYRLEQSLAKPFAILTTALGQKVTPQILRRSLNTNLGRAGFSAIEIQAILGHSSDAMTARYTHVSIARKAELLAALDAR
jgi:integrase